MENASTNNPSDNKTTDQDYNSYNKNNQKNKDNLIFKFVVLGINFIIN